MEEYMKFSCFSYTVPSGEVTYSIGICASPLDAKSKVAIQQNDKNNYTLGLLDQANLVVGGWALLSFCLW
jgi:hypothetical protein